MGADVGAWVEPWVGRFWDRMDLNAALTDRLTIVPLDVLDLSARERDLLGEWVKDWDARQKKAADAARAK